ncbi:MULTISPECIES: hypothetical protein [Flavobacterium]|jgi:hypothetical protein|uniref:Recombinase domain-containing protein n=1 Tax=Flavobacterium jumunjinense TaxID=998845 RepID=A0ABV5GQ82_9FLAO|nr:MULTISPECIES: hypothetical protein [Flavobacterium]
MIKSSEKEIIVRYLGKQPSKTIIPILNKKRILNARGKQFSPKSIQDIINGKTENIRVETQIVKIVEAAKRKENNIEALKTQVFN